MHNLHSLGSIPARHYLTLKNCLTNNDGCMLTGYLFNTWVESSKFRLISCQRILVPCRDSNPRPSHLQSSALNHSTLMAGQLYILYMYKFIYLPTRPVKYSVVCGFKMQSQIYIWLPRIMKQNQFLKKIWVMTEDKSNITAGIFN